MYVTHTYEFYKLEDPKGGAEKDFIKYFLLKEEAVLLF